MSFLTKKKKQLPVKQINQTYTMLTKALCKLFGDTQCAIVQNNARYFAPTRIDNSDWLHAHSVFYVVYDLISMNNQNCPH